MAVRKESTMKKTYLVQVCRVAPTDFVRKHWHEVEAEDSHEAVAACLRKMGEKAFLRFIRMTGGEAYASVALKVYPSGTSNIRPSGMPIVVNGYNLKFDKKAA
jgi:hypothetical protein